MHFEHARVDGHACDWSDIAQEIETELVIEGGIDRMGGADREERVAVGRCAHDCFGRDVCPTARPVLDYERLAEPVRQPLADQSGENVLPATWGITHDDAHWP